uniref:Uncharacterized protein n=1 Tax=viral metagenome TaxID=1070528 RepID=A0A6H1ZFS5_9ZZZZ
MAKKVRIENHIHCPDCGEILEVIGSLFIEDLGLVEIYKCLDSIFIYESWKGKIKKIYSYEKETKK